jgi:hypothetical protein
MWGKGAVSKAHQLRPVRARLIAAFTFAAVVLFSSSAIADTVNLGLLIYQGFIPGVNGGPGTFSVEVDNLTGLPPDFYGTPIDFSNVNLELTLADHSLLECAVGSIGSQETNTDCQIPSSTLLLSIVATGNFPSIQVKGGQLFDSFSTRLDPNSADSFAVIRVGSSVSEPPGIFLGAAGLLVVGFKLHRSRRSLSIPR